MAINPNDILTDVKLWLPESNVLTDTQMLTIINLVIGQVGDEDEKYAEVLCKSLRAIALANQAKYSVDVSGKRKEEVGDVEVQWFEATSSDVWSNFIDSLKDICPLFGYTGLDTGIGMQISPGKKIKINKCLCPDDELIL